MNLPKKSLVYSFALVVAGAAFFSVLALYLAYSKLLDQQYRATDVEKAVSIGYVIDAYVSNEIRRLRQLGLTLASNDEVANAVLDATRAPTGDFVLSRAAQQQLGAWIPHLEIAGLMLTNRENGIVYQHGALDRVFVSRDEIEPSIEQTAIGRVGQVNGIMHKLPLSVGGRNVGALTLAVKLDDRFASRIANDTFTAISLVSPEGAISSSLPSGTDTSSFGPLVARARATKLPVQVHDEKTNTSQVFVSTQIVDQPYVVVIGVQSDTALATLAAARTLAIKIAVGVLLLALIVGGAYVYRVTRPLRQLQKRAEDVVASQSGESPPQVAGDEVQQLVQRFDWMTERLLARTEALDRARAISDQANEAKSLFVANVSHEIRTPMNGVLGMLQVLGATQLTADQRHHTSTAQRAAENLLAVINELLDFSKAEANRISLEKRPFSLIDVLADVEALFEARMSEKGLRFHIHRAPSVPIALVGDPLRLRQILVNLIGNAHKFTDRGAITVSVSQRPSDDDALQTCLLIDVTDSGLGIAPTEQAKVFEAFMQAEGAATTRKFGGTGLGLAISRHLARLMGGELSVSSEVGVGSTFSLNVAFERDEGTHPEMHITTALKSCRAIIVTSDEALAGQFAGLLGQWSLTTHHAPSLAEARRLARQSLDTAVLFWDLKSMHPLSVIDADSSDPAQGARINVAIAPNATLPVDPALPDFRYTIVSTPDRAALFSAVTLLASGDAEILRARELVAASAPPINLPIKHAEATTRGRPRALLVDDNDINLLVGKAMLGQLGIDVDTANDGIQATEASKITPYDIVFMDLHMPHLDGLGAAKAIRGLETRGAIPSGSRLMRRLPIIALSASVYQEDVARCMTAGMDAFLGKPLKAAELRAVINQWVYDKVV